MTEGEKLLRNVITGKLRKRLENIWLIGEDSYLEAQKGDNIQGYFHCRAVEDNLGKLVSDEKKKTLKQLSLFLLSTSACLHDIGKVVKDDHKGWKSDHGKRSAEIILRDYLKLGLKKPEAIAVAYIVSVHGDGQLDELPKTPFAIGCEEVDLIGLAAIFRLGDMLDTSCQRAPEILSDILFPDGNIPSKWQGRQAITGWYLDKAGRIILQAVPETSEELEAVYVSHRMMKEDLAKISVHLMICGYPWEMGDLDIKSEVFLESKLEKKAIAQKPFPGMGFYTRDDAKIFRGREAEIANSLSIISYKPISLLIGESGSGKTSLIRAGIFPRLESMGWKCVWTRPFDKPQENIKETVWQTFFHGRVDPQKSLFDVLREAAENSKPNKLLVAIDQFEDLLNLGVQEVLDDFSLALRAVQAGTIIPNLKVLISFREDASVRLNNRLLKKVTGSAQQFPSLELERLDRAGAKEAILAGLEHAGIGLDISCEVGQKQLIEVILDDLQKGNHRIFPPFVQIVAEALCRRVMGRKPPMITRDVYFEELKGADSMITNYLVNQLEQFGDQQERAKRLLVALTSSGAMKAKPKSLSELSEETEISLDEARKVISIMVDFRMLRSLGNDEFELIHDYLGKIVDEKLVQEDDRVIKFLGEQLDAYQQAYKLNKSFIIEPIFIASLYRNRRKVKISEDKYPLIICSMLCMDGISCWYFLKDIETWKIRELLKEQIGHPDESVRRQALSLFCEIATHDDISFLIKVLKLSHDQWSPSRAFAKIALPQDRELLVKMLPKTEYAMVIVLRALWHMTQPGDKEFLVGLLQDSDELIRHLAVEALSKIGQPQEARKWIVMMLEDQSCYDQTDAIEALAEIAPLEAKDLIVKRLQNRNPKIRIAAAQALARIAQPEDKELIIKLLRKGEHFEVEGEIHTAAAQALARIAQPEDKELIIKLLQKHKYFVDRGATKALARIAQPEDKELIIKLLQNARYNKINYDINLRPAAEALARLTEDLEGKEALLDYFSEKAKGFNAEHKNCLWALSLLDEIFYSPLRRVLPGDVDEFFRSPF